MKYNTRFSRNKYFNRIFRGTNSKRVTGQMFRQMSPVSGSKNGVAFYSCVLDPLYMLYNDARFATWRSMYDEYRISKVMFIIQPTVLSSASLTANIAFTSTFGWDRNGAYQNTTDTTASVSTQNILALEGSKYQQFFVGAEWKKTYMTLTPAAQENMWLNSQFAPNTTSGGISNIGPYFDPNLYIGGSTAVGNFAGVNDVNYTIELKLWVEGRG